MTAVAEDERELPPDCPVCGDDDVAEATGADDRQAARVRYVCHACSYVWTEQSSETAQGNEGPTGGWEPRTS